MHTIETDVDHMLAVVHPDEVRELTWSHIPCIPHTSPERTEPSFTPLFYSPTDAQGTNGHAPGAAAPSPAGGHRPPSSPLTAAYSVSSLILHSHCVK
jgi:hypothetical protein